ncbi:MAG: response regulator [Halarcobacter sp.]
MNNDLAELIKYTKNLKILFIEDNKEVRNQLIKFLNNFFLDIDVACDGSDALDIYINNNHQYDLIITDISMPKLDGIEFSKKVKDLNKEQTILIISAHTETDKLNTLRQLGVFDIIQKPVGYEKLIEVLGSVRKSVSV